MSREPPKGRPAYWSLDALAERWDVHRRTVVREIERGRLHAVRVANVLRVPDGAVEAYESRNQVMPRPR